MSIDSKEAPLVLLCPAWKHWGTATTVKPNTVILHSRADDVVAFEDSVELLQNSGLPASALIEVGEDHRLRRCTVAQYDAGSRGAGFPLRACNMYVIGSDFTSAPKPGKPITVAHCQAKSRTLAVERIDSLVNFQSFSRLLNSQGPWIAGIDFPFGQPQQLIEDLNWERNWERYVRHVATLGKTDFRKTIDAYRKRQPPGRKEHRRDVDTKAGSVSPMKMYGTPVGVMFCEGAPFLVASPASVLPSLPQRDDSRIIVEAYPKLVAMKIVGKTSYKTDTKNKTTKGHQDTRRKILKAIKDSVRSAVIRKQYGFHVQCSDTISKSCIKDTSGDLLDAVLCALQAAWAWTKRRDGFGIPNTVNALEGWIVDPALLDR